MTTHTSNCAAIARARSDADHPLRRIADDDDVSDRSIILRRTLMSAFGRDLENEINCLDLSRKLLKAGPHPRRADAMAIPT